MDPAPQLTVQCLACRKVLSYLREPSVGAVDGREMGSGAPSCSRVSAKHITLHSRKSLRFLTGLRVVHLIAQ